MSVDQPPKIHVRYANGLLSIDGETTRHLRITAQAMLQDLLACVDERSIDLICVAAGSYAIDRIHRRRRTRANDAGLRTFAVCFHVSDEAYWTQSHVADQIAELLHFLTGDLWLISFIAHDRPQLAAIQTHLDLNTNWRPSRVALYSGGLDSAAGLACALLRGQGDFVLLTAGHQSSIRRRALDQVKGIKHLLPGAGSISHASFVLHLERSGRLSDQEMTQRSRGFLFCASGAVLAAACNIDQIDIYENGHGALNLPLSAGGMTNGLSTRGAHPAFLMMMTRLVSDVLERPLRFSLPYIGMTKAEMVAEISSASGLADWAQQSRSCVHTSWRELGITHCGKCPACIERHQAFEAAHVVDSTSYSRRIWEQVDALDDSYFRSYLWQAQRWSQGDRDIHARLDDYCAISQLPPPSEELVRLHQRHAAEVLQTYARHVEPSISAQPASALQAVA